MCRFRRNRRSTQQSNNPIARLVDADFGPLERGKRSFLLLKVENAKSPPKLEINVERTCLFVRKWNTNKSRRDIIISIVNNK